MFLFDPCFNYNTQSTFYFRKYNQICPVHFSAAATLLIWCDGPKPSKIKKKMLLYVNTSYVHLSLALGVADSKLTCLLCAKDPSKSHKSPKIRILLHQHLLNLFLMETSNSNLFGHAPSPGVKRRESYHITFLCIDYHLFEHTINLVYVRGGWGHPLLDNNNLLYRHHRRNCTVKQRAIHTHTRSHARTRTNVDHYTTDLQHKHSTVRATSGRHHPKLHRKQG